MKKSILFILLLFVSLSCESKKGAWTFEDKEKARTSIESALKSEGINPKDMQDAIDCCVRRLEIYYENFEEAEFDEEGATKLCLDCLMKDFDKVLENIFSDEESGC
jgi:hypothetical protein